VGVERKR
jgi:hypothetical protein